MKEGSVGNRGQSPTNHSNTGHRPTAVLWTPSTLLEHGHNSISPHQNGAGQHADCFESSFPVEDRFQVSDASDCQSLGLGCAS